MDHLDLNKRLKEEALALLTETGAMDVLQSFGEPHFYGGYKLNVMAWCEVDIALIMDPLTAARVYSLLGALDECLHPAEAFLMNQLDHRYRRGPGNSFHLDLRTEPSEDHGCWKLDMFCRAPSASGYSDAFGDRIEAELDDDKRRAIIEIKERFHHHPGYRTGVWVHHQPDHFFSSSDVYDAVIQDGIRSYDEFSDYIHATHGIRIDDEMPNKPPASDPEPSAAT